MDAAQLFKLLSDGGILFGSVLLIVLLVNERLVPKARLEALQKLLDQERAERATEEAQDRTDKLADDERRRQAMVEGMARLASLEERIAKREEAILASLTVVQRAIERIRLTLAAVERAVERLRP
jgi:hypothetical protein